MSEKTFQITSISLFSFLICLQCCTAFGIFNGVRTNDSNKFEIFTRNLVTMSSWSPNSDEHVKQAKENLKVWPLDEYNVQLLNEASIC